MKIKRITLEVEVPIRTVTANEILAVVQGYLNSKATPHQAQVEYKLSPNTQIGNVAEFDSSSYYFYVPNGIYIRVQK